MHVAKNIYRKKLQLDLIIHLSWYWNRVGYRLFSYTRLAQVLAFWKIPPAEKIENI